MRWEKYKKCVCVCGLCFQEYTLDVTWNVPGLLFFCLTEYCLVCSTVCVGQPYIHISPQETRSDPP